MKNRVLVVGRGFLGSYLVETLKHNDVDVAATHLNATDPYQKLDIVQKEDVEKYVEKFKPSLIVNCAGIGKIDFLEKNPKLAFLVNSEGVRNIAQISKKYEIRLIHISTDSVFDGTKGMYVEEDEVNPTNVYAKSKVLAENYVKELLDNYVIARTNFFGFDKRGNGLFNWAWNRLRQNKELTGYSNILFNPLEVSNLSNIIWELAITNYSGIIHLASKEVISKYQFIQKIAEIFKFDKAIIKEGNSESDSQLVAKRPKNTSLATIKADRLLQTPLFSITQSLSMIKNNMDQLV